jgi:hypothetical protein
MKDTKAEAVTAFILARDAYAGAIPTQACKSAVQVIGAVLSKILSS